MAKLDTTGFWKIDNSPIFTPDAGIKITHTNVAGSESGRTEDGRMHIDWVRTDVKKVFFTYKTMSASELDYLLNLMQGKEFVLTYKDRGKKCTMNAYCAESTYEFYSDVLGLYTNVSINAIEL